MRDVGCKQVIELVGHHAMGALRAVTARPNRHVVRANLFNQPRNIKGIVLAIAIHHQDDLAASMTDARLDRSAVPDIVGMRDDLHLQRLQPLQCFVCRTIIDDNHFPRPSKSLENENDLLNEADNRIFFVVYRDNNADTGASVIVIKQPARAFLGGRNRWSGIDLQIACWGCQVLLPLSGFLRLELQSVEEDSNLPAVKGQLFIFQGCRDRTEAKFDLPFVS